MKIHAHFDLTDDVPVMDIYHCNGEISNCSALGANTFIEVDIYYIGQEFILAEDDSSHMAIPKQKLLSSVKNREYWEEKLDRFNKGEEPDKSVPLLEPQHLSEGG